MPIVPDKRPLMSREALESIAHVNSVNAQVFLVGRRGEFRDSLGVPCKNDFGLYDDAIWLVSPSAVAGFNANTDPSAQAKGIAQLMPGVHLYKPGHHRISRPPSYPALRPATAGERLPVWRDGKQSVGIAINIHRGSRNSTSSEGCQTVYPDQWDAFINLVYVEMKRYGQKVIPYILVVKPDL